MSVISRLRHHIASLDMRNQRPSELVLSKADYKALEVEMKDLLRYKTPGVRASRQYKFMGIPVKMESQEKNS